MRRSLSLLFLGLGALAGALGAQVGSGAQRTTISSDRQEMQGTEDRNYFHFVGNVVVLGTDLEIHCDELTVTALRGGRDNATIGEIGAIEKILAVGNVSIAQADRTAYAGRVEVDPVLGTIRFLENPVIVQGDFESRAYGFVFYTRDKKIEAMNPPGFQPGQSGRAVISLSGATQFSMDVPESALLAGGREASTGSEEAPAEAIPSEQAPVPGEEPEPQP